MGGHFLDLARFSSVRQWPNALAARPETRDREHARLMPRPRSKRRPSKRRKPATDKLNAFGIDAVCGAIVEGKMLREIARRAGVSISKLLFWLAADPGRSIRAREARALSAWMYDERAEQVLLEAKTSEQIQRARELAHHYRWRSAKIAPSYADRGDAEPMPLPASGKIDILAEARRTALLLYLGDKARAEQEVQQSPSAPIAALPAPLRVREAHRTPPTGGPASHPAAEFLRDLDARRTEWLPSDWSTVAGVNYYSLEPRLRPHSIMVHDERDHPSELVTEHPEAWRERIGKVKAAA